MKLENLLLIALCLFTFAGCDKTEDPYYEKPEWLQPPIYQVLEAEGRFTSYLQCVDRTDYAKVLKSAALSTVFAPNDSAFKSFLAKKAYNSVADIPDDVVRKLVAYSIVYSKIESIHLGDDGAFKKKTNNYSGPYKDSEFNNNWVVDETYRGGFSYSVIDYQVNMTAQNYKYLPVFSDTYFAASQLTNSDFNTFYPNSTYTGDNVQEGEILKADIVAENGIIHEVSTVNEPLPNIEKILSKPEYGSFRNLLSAHRSSTELPVVLAEAFQQMLPHETIDKLYLKYYPTSLAFSPLLENIFDPDGGYENSASSGNTLFVPESEVLNSYIQSRLLKYYGSLDEMPSDVILNLINTHMVNGLIWPSQYKGSFNSTGEYLNGQGMNGKDFTSDGILGSKMASNGFVYRIDHVIKSRFFESVYAGIYLNPAYRYLDLAYQLYYPLALREELMRCPLNGNISERFTLLNFSNDLITGDGFVYGEESGVFTNPVMSDPYTAAAERLKRLMRMHIFPGVNDGVTDSEIVSFNGPTGDQPTNYNGWAFAVNYYGDMVRYKNNQLQAAGNIEDNTVVNLTKVADEFNNGSVYTIDRLLQYSARETGESFSEISLWEYLDRARTQSVANVKTFVDYVEACMRVGDTNELSGISAENFYTVLMVNNSAMNKAILAEHIPPLDSLTSATDATKYIAQATMFLNAHFLQGTVLADDGRPYIYPVNPMSPALLTVPTVHRITNESLGLVNQRTFVDVTKTVRGLLRFTPKPVTVGSKVLVEAGVGDTRVPMAVQRGRVTGSAIDANIFKSNRIAGKAVLHEVNNYFVFNEETDNN
jgi:uncharacterized surface protein with fasciclin (FAS1) repeats